MMMTRANHVTERCSSILLASGRIPRLSQIEWMFATMLIPLAKGSIVAIKTLSKRFKSANKQMPPFPGVTTFTGVESCPS